MHNLKSWFINLSRVGKVSTLSAIALGGLFFASGATPPAPSTPISQPVTAIKNEQKDLIITTQTETETIAVPYSKTSRTDSTLAKGEARIDTAGVNGEKTIVYTITLKDKVETGRTSTESISKLPIDEVTSVGTYVAPVVTKKSAPTASPSTQSSSAYYKNCTAARAAGAAPVYAGQPGYGKHLDRDGDGVGCE